MSTPHEDGEFPGVQALIGGLAVESFVSEYFDKKLLHSCIKLEQFAFTSIEEVLYVLQEMDIPISNIDMARDGKVTPKHEFESKGYADRSTIWKMYDEGHAIIFRGATRWLPKLRSACAAVSKTLHCQTQANIYLTPARSFSAPPHFDPHHLFIIQVQGEKNWELFDGSFSRPRPRDRFDQRKHAVRSKTGSIYLRRGSVLYLPRGVIHRPVSISDSVHISIGCAQISIGEFLEFLCDFLSGKNEVLREHVPVDIRTGHIDTHSLTKSLIPAFELLSDVDRVGEACSLISVEDSRLL
jgi:ribosomal protein L16 Arg81 hydroxylase